MIPFIDITDNAVQAYPFTYIEKQFQLVILHLTSGCYCENTVGIEDQKKEHKENESIWEETTAL